MALTIVKNYGDFTGDFLGEPGVTATTNIVETNIVGGITATKSADKEFWINGPLTYTIELTNDSGEPYENVVLTDQLDPLTVLDQTYGVFVNNVKVTNYTYTAGMLTVPAGDIPEGGDVTVSFRVLQA